MKCRMNACPSIQPTEHAERVEVLHELASIMGFSDHFLAFPDGTRPDVFRLNPTTGGIFLGEAKATERPTCVATKQRFANYARWLATSRARLSASVCAICFSDIADDTGWEGLIREALVPVGVIPLFLAVTEIEYPGGLVCAVLRPSSTRLTKPIPSSVY